MWLQMLSYQILFSLLRIITLLGTNILSCTQRRFFFKPSSCSTPQTVSRNLSTRDNKWLHISLSLKIQFCLRSKYLLIFQAVLEQCRNWSRGKSQIKAMSFVSCLNCLSYFIIERLIQNTRKKKLFTRNIQDCHWVYPDLLGIRHRRSFNLGSKNKKQLNKSRKMRENPQLYKTVLYSCVRYRAWNIT